ncbi:MAG: diguanylate cyclase, partial [Bacillota bacterium]|nr:diguanylate cyclase [Bacillota bacterium]
MKIINDRYEIVSVISDEFNSIEYIVKDHHNWGMRKVMKIFDADAMNLSFLRFFENSFVDLKNHKHPNIVNLYEFSPIRSSNDIKVSSNQYFYTYEYVSEKQISYLDLEKSQISEVIAQLCKVIRFLHFRGVVYKYLNFENIKIYLKPDNDVVVKLSNLANISIIDYQNTASYEFSGDFMAPELNWGENIDYTADIYSFGIIFYYLYYKKDYRTKALNNITSTNPLNLFIARCASQISEDRYQNINELIDELSRLIWIEVPKDDYRYYDRIQDRTRLVGREVEVANIMDIIDKKTQKNTSYKRIQLEGENGSGKTRTMREIARLCGFRQYNYVNINVPRNAEPYYCVKEVVSYILHHDFSISNLISKYGMELGLLLPDFFKSFALSVEEINLNDDYLRIINRAVKFVHEYCGSRYLIILVDGAEHMQEYDKIFFNQLLSGQTNVGILAVLALPHGERRSYNGTTLDIKLTYFDVEQIGEMVKNLLGVNYIPFDLVHAVLLETRGKASQIRSLLVAYYYSGVIRFCKDTFTWVFSDNDSDYSISNYSEYIKVRDDLLEGISERDKENLKRLAVINKGFGREGTIKMFGLSEFEGELVLTHLLDKNLVTENISDMHYVYTIQDRDIKNLLFQSLSQPEVRVFSALAANVAMEEYRQTGYLDENIVDYFNNAMMYESVAEYALIIAEINVKTNNLSKVIDMLEISEQMYRKLGHIEKADSIVIRLSENLYNLGSIEYMLRVLEGRQYVRTEHEIKARRMLAKAYLDQGKTPEAREHLTQSMELAEKNELHEELLRCYMIKLDYYFMTWNRGKIVDTVKQAEEFAQRHQQDSYVDYFRYIRTLMEDEEGEEIEKRFEVAKNAFREMGDFVTLINLYNYEAKRIYINEGDLEKSVALFKISENIADTYNYYRYIVDYYYTTGVFHWIASNYADAAEQLEKAMIYARNYGVTSIGVSALSKYVSTKLELCEYRQANIQLSKLEYELKSYGAHSAVGLDLFIYKLQYLCAMNHVVEAKQLRYEISTDEIHNPSDIFKIKCLDIRIKYMTELLRGRLEIGENILVALHELSGDSFNLGIGNVYRKLLLEIAVNLVMSSDISYISRLLKLDESASGMYDSKELQIARNVVIAYLSEDAIEKLSELAEQSASTSIEMTWRIHYLKGNLYMNEKNDVESLKSYLLAFEIVKDLADRVPAAYHRQYLLNDPYKMMLRTQISTIIKNLCDVHGLNVDYNLPKIMTVEDYFDMTAFVKMMESDKVATLITGKSVALDSAELIESFGVDDRKNLHRVLEYLASEIFATRAYIIVLGDDENHFRDIISLRKEDERKNFTKLLYGLGNEKSVVASKLNSNTQVHILKGGQKGLIHLPITELQGERRRARADDFIRKRKKIIAHLFFETDNILNRFDEKYLKYIESYSSLIAVFIDSTKLKFSSTVDKLTKVHLRKYFEQEFSMLMSEARVSDEELSVIILDIDNFKGVNDNYGHKRGDMVLAAVGNILVNSVRSTDLVARYGGEEFILLLPETGMDPAYLVAEKIRRNVEAAELLGKDRPLTISLGVSTYPQSGSSEEELIENADKALYYSKGHGKNQTTKWDRSILNQAKRFDRLTGIVSGRVEEDMRHVQAMLNIIGELGG